MHFLWFGTGATQNLEVVANWRETDEYGSYAGAVATRLPAVGDTVHITDSGTNLGSNVVGQLDCDLVHIELASVFDSVTFNSPVKAIDSTIYDCVFNAPLDMVYGQSSGTFNSSVRVDSGFVAGTFNDRLSLDYGQTWLYAPSSPDIASPADVRRGVWNTDVTGECAIPPAAKVLAGEPVDVIGTEGSLVLPDPGDVRDETTYGVGGNGSKGTLVVGSSGGRVEIPQFSGISLR